MIRRMKDYPIGTHYLSAGKHPRLCTVVDILKTYNSAGALVCTRYVATHQFAGQCVHDRNVVAATIARGIARLQESKMVIS